MCEVFVFNFKKKSENNLTFFYSPQVRGKISAKFLQFMLSGIPFRKLILASKTWNNSEFGSETILLNFLTPNICTLASRGMLKNVANLLHPHTLRKQPDVNSCCSFCSQYSKLVLLLILPENFFIE